MEESNFVFQSVDLLYYSLHKTNLNRGGSYIDYPSWIKNNNKCFRDAITAALNHKKINIAQKEYLILSLFLINIIEGYRVPTTVKRLEKILTKK